MSAMEGAQKYECHCIFYNFFQYLKSAKVPPSLDSKIWQKFKAINCAQVIKKKMQNKIKSFYKFKGQGKVADSFNDLDQIKDKT